MAIYAVARNFMQETGNGSQWINGYPPEELIRQSIAEGSQYVAILDGEVAGAFYFKVEDDPTYAKIYDGQWLNDRPYGVVHRLASSGKYRGIGNYCLQWCLQRYCNIRVDTHRDNLIMQKILKRNGFLFCGIIYVQNGSERLAFQQRDPAVNIR